MEEDGCVVTIPTYSTKHDEGAKDGYTVPTSFLAIFVSLIFVLLFPNLPLPPALLFVQERGAEPLSSSPLYGDLMK
jgi:hypothetical protein